MFKEETVNNVEKHIISNVYKTKIKFYPASLILELVYKVGNGKGTSEMLINRL